MRWLAAGGLLTFASCFGQTFFISIFADQIMNDYSLTNGEWGRIYGLGTMSSGLLLIWAGAFTDKYRVKALASIMLCVLAVFCVAMALNTNAAFLVFLIFGLRFSGQGMLHHISTVAMARWFSAARGKALAIGALGFSFGEALLPLTFVALMLWLPWRGLWLLSAILALALIPVLRRLLSSERTPQAIAKEQGTAGMAGRHWTRPEVLRHWLFWLILPASMAPAVFSTAFFFQQVHFSASKGWELVHLVALFPLFTASAVLSVMLFGAAIDRWGSARLIPLFQIPMAAAFLIWGPSTQLWHALAGLVLMGIMQGGNTVVPAAFWSEFYGTRHLGAIKSMATAVMVLGSAIGPAVTGALIDRGVDFQDQMIWIAGLILFGCLTTYLGVSRARRVLETSSAAA